MLALPQAPQLQVLSQGQFLEAQQSHSQGREDSGNSSCLWTFSWKPEDLPSFSWASLTLHNARCPHPFLFQPWHQVTYNYNHCLKKLKIFDRWTMILLRKLISIRSSRVAEVVFCGFLRFVVIFALFGRHWANKSVFLGSKTVFLGQEMQYYMVGIANYT